MRPLLLRTAAALALAALLAACTQKNTADQQGQQADPAANVALGIDRLLLFPNPIGTDPFARDGGTFETDTIAYASAYYAAIDPTNAEDTIDKWRAANGFTGFGNRPGTEHLAVFRDVKDLGYGRRMTGRRNSDDGSVAFYVENYNVAPNGSPGYASDLNVDAAIRRDTQWHVGTNAIEWTSTPCIPNYDPADCDNTGTVKFAKYYNFSSKDGTRQLAVDLDGHGLKAMPGACITCHGGRGDPLTPPDLSGKPRFPLVENSLSRKRGDVQARLHGMNVDSFGYSTTEPGFAKSDLQPFLADFNQWILCTYPSPTAATVNNSAAGTSWTSCARPIAGQNEWQGTAAEMIQSWYGGPTMPGPFSDTYVPAGWNSSTAITGTTFAPIDLYKNVVAPYCRTCHILRGTKNQDDINFFNFGTPAAGVTPATGFLSYADRIKVMVFDRGNMPLAQIPHQDFWSSSAPQMLASFVDAQSGVGTATANGAPLMPGRPIADPGPDRMVRTGSDAVLTGENSLFTGTFAWTNITGPGAPLITNSNAMVATFNASVAGTYVVRLTVDGGAFKDVTITVDDNFPDPLKIKFAHVKNVLQNVVHATGQKCVGCHKDISTPQPAATPPIWYTDFDRDGSGVIDATDDDWFVKALSGRVNLTEIQASPLLRKPSGNHHAGNKLFDLTTTAGLQSYSILYNWILDGMPAGGVAANPGPNTISPPLTLTFNGVFPGPFTASIPLDGSASVGSGALSYLWTIGSQPLGGFAVFPGNAFTSGAAVTSLTIHEPGTYVAQLQVSDGPSTDVAQRTIVVNETPLAANVTVAGLSAGNVAVTFAGTPAAGSIGVTANQTAGNPVTCGWQVAPTALNPFATGVSVGPSSCSSATLNVLPGAIGSQFTVTLTEQNLSLPAVLVSQTFTVQAAAGSNPSGADFNPITTTALGWTISGSLANAPARTISGVTLQGTAAGPGPLNFSWTTTGTGCSIPAGQSTSTTKVLSISQVGSCSVTMTVSNGILPNAVVTKAVTITSSVLFANVATILGNPLGSGAQCTGCHNGTNAVPDWRSSTAGLAGRLAGVIDGTQQSLLLLCPTFGSGAGGSSSCTGMPAPQPGFGSGGFANYDAFLTWIFNGQP